MASLAARTATKKGTLGSLSCSRTFLLSLLVLLTLVSTAPRPALALPCSDETRVWGSHALTQPRNPCRTALNHHRVWVLSLSVRRTAAGVRVFLSQDPMGFAGGDLNLYQYARANPVRYTDPTGLVTGLDDFVALLLIAAIAGNVEFGIAAHLRGANEEERAEQQRRGTFVGLGVGAGVGGTAGGFSALAQGARASLSNLRALLGLGGAAAAGSGSGPAAQSCPTVGPGNFPARDFALGFFTRIKEFAGSARTGFQIDVPRGQMFIEALEGELQQVAAAGGRIRFDATGFDPRQALAPGSEFYLNLTSQEFRLILQRFTQQTDFYVNGAQVPLESLLGR